MSDTAATTYLVTGATRGLGLALVSAIAAKDPSAVIYAGGRHPSGTPRLVELEAKYTGRVVPNSTGKVHETTAQNYEDHFAVNVLGPIVLFQAFRAILKASPHPRFIAISSGAGSIGLVGNISIDNAPYVMSKAALNWIICKIHFENDWLIRQSIIKDTTGKFKEVFDSLIIRQPDEVANILVDTVSESTREKYGGQFHSVDAGRHDW
ncbi:NAD(P)-binding protein [Pholiota conissans]|uniref:NAD(P)-binding protein n=1 Tax=Pholiota conissans TaxID=109636 RepID=A0A9P6CQG3_9AGAR|nr:NAD(P)-binding protein [Pholiota conissans]